MTGSNPPLSGPELVFGLAGPIGVDLGLVSNCFQEALSRVMYQSSIIKLTDEMYSFGPSKTDKTNGGFYQSTLTKIDYANNLRRSFKDTALLARVSIAAIMRSRVSVTGSVRTPQLRHAYILHQLKRPEEVNLLRRIYGRNFILVSAFGTTRERREIITAKIRESVARSTSDVGISHNADKLIDRDASELNDMFGQQLRETFHKADLFVDGIRAAKTQTTVERFVNALFGRTDISPSKNEYGMYIAKASSLRSADLSRQVGAALFTPEGDIIAQGCNEVPKAFGGTYWDLEEPDFRDAKIGYDPNERQKRELLRDLFEHLESAKMLSPSVKSIGDISQIVREVLAKNGSPSQTPSSRGALADAEIMDLTEYGRVVHAEMCVVCDAARLGRSTKKAILYCTTFPCHNCTKHLLAAGVAKVVFIEPYPKSKAKELHKEEIEIDGPSDDKVVFEPFLGISPLRYRDIFEKGRRKDIDGQAKKWIASSPHPILVSDAPLYISLESSMEGVAGLYASATAKAKRKTQAMVSRTRIRAGSKAQAKRKQQRHKRR